MKYFNKIIISGMFFTLLISCSKSPLSGNTGSQALTSGLYQYDPCVELRFSQGLTETNFTRLVECLHKNHGIGEGVKSLLLTQPGFAVSAFNTLFADEETRQESFELFENL